MANIFITVTRPIYFGWIAIIKDRNTGFSNGILCTVIDDLGTRSNKLQLYLYEDEYQIIIDEKEIARLNKIMVFK